jgi:hypothetical protein
LSVSAPATERHQRHGTKRKPAFFGWATNYLIDVKNAVIMDVAATPAIRSAEVDSAKVMIDRVEGRFGVLPKRLIGDTAYGTAEMVAWMVEEKAIEPHVPLWEKGEREDGTFSRSDFIFDTASNTFTCPGGKRLQQYRRNFEHERSGITKANTRIYRASQVDCGACALKQKCCPGQPWRKVVTSVYEAARNVVRLIRDTPLYLQSRRDRKKVEMLFAHLMRILKQAGSPQAAWSFRRTRRIYTGRRRAEPSQVGDARIPSPAAGAKGGMRRVATPAALGARIARARSPLLNALGASAQRVVQQNWRGTAVPILINLRPLWGGFNRSSQHLLI